MSETQILAIKYKGKFAEILLERGLCFVLVCSEGILLAWFLCVAQSIHKFPEILLVQPPNMHTPPCCGEKTFLSLKEDG